VFLPSERGLHGEAAHLGGRRGVDAAEEALRAEAPRRREADRALLHELLVLLVEDALQRNPRVRSDFQFTGTESVYSARQCT
jgi:hypothetical protein